MFGGIIIKKVLILIGFLFFCLFFLSGIVSATNYTVTPGDSIQTKINNAKNGDTLNMAVGTYNQYNINMNKNLTIAGPTTSGTPTAVIDAQHHGRVFYIPTGVKVTLKYLTITNGDTSEEIPPNGGGICNDGTCTIVGCKINSNTATTSFGGGIYNSGTCTVTGSKINSNTASVGGGIFNTGTCTVTGSNINSNTATDGGGIHNEGTCTVTASNINSNTATTGIGGGIHNEDTCTVTDSKINSNTATYGGGIYNYDTCTVTGSKINSNTATYGGGIWNYDTCTVTESDFESNKASSSGNAIHNSGGDLSTNAFHFNRFYDTNPGYEIYCASGSVDAMFNWWGSNSEPSSKVYGPVDINPWLVFKLNANPTLIGKGVKSNLTANLRYDSTGNYHNPTNGYFPNNIAIQFSTSLGSITSPVSSFSGTAKAILTGGSTSGVADVFASLDDEIVATTVKIETVPPTVTSTDPANNAVNVPSNKVIKVTFSENIKNGTGWIELKNSSGTVIPITVSVSGNVLTISHSSVLAESLYTLAIHTGSVTDLAGNPVAATISKFSVGTSPTVTTSDPANNAVNVPRNKQIKITFSEPIKAGTMWIELYNTVGTKTPIPITTSISGNVLTINHAALLATGTKYTLALHTGSITDLVGNNLAGVARYFTTGTT